MPRSDTAPTQVISLYRRYGFRGIFRLATDVLATKLTFTNARLMRRPFYIRGKSWMRLGNNLTTGPGLRIDAFPFDPGAGPVLTIGNDVQLNDYVHIAAVSSVHIGNRVLIAGKVFITDHNHGTYNGLLKHDSPIVPPATRPLSFAPVRIEDDVWIGEVVSVLPGVTIGKGAIIGTMSTVTHDVPPYTIAVGTPARPIKHYNFENSTWEPL